MGPTCVLPPRGHGTEIDGPHAGRRGMDRLAHPLGSPANPRCIRAPVPADRPDMPDLPKLRVAPADKDGGTSRHRDIAAALPRIVPPKGEGRGVSLRPAGSHL